MMVGTTAAESSGAPGGLQPACNIPFAINSRAGSAVLPSTQACMAITFSLTKHSVLVMMKQLTWMVS